jgi:hypothetical protein
MDETLFISSLTAALPIVSTISYKLGRREPTARYDENVDARQRAQSALSSAQLAVTDANIKVQWIMIDLPTKTPTHGLDRITMTIDKIEHSYSEMTEHLTEAKRLQAQRKRTSPHLYHRSSEKLYEFTKEFTGLIAYLNDYVQDLNNQNEKLSTEALKRSLAEIQRNKLHIFRAYVNKTHMASDPIHHDRTFKEFAANVAKAESAALVIEKALGADDTDRYLVSEDINKLSQDCEQLKSAHWRLDPHGRVVYFARKFTGGRGTHSSGMV